MRGTWFSQFSNFLRASPGERGKPGREIGCYRNTRLLAGRPDQKKHDCQGVFSGTERESHSVAPIRPDGCFDMAR